MSDDYRFGDADEDAARAAIRRSLASGPFDHEHSVYVAAHALGVLPSQLTGTERQWIDNEIGEQRLGIR